MLASVSTAALGEFRILSSRYRYCCPPNSHICTLHWSRQCTRKELCLPAGGGRKIRSSRMFVDLYRYFPQCLECPEGNNGKNEAPVDWLKFQIYENNICKNNKKAKTHSYHKGNHYLVEDVVFPYAWGSFFFMIFHPTLTFTSYSDL